MMMTSAAGDIASCEIVFHARQSQSLLHVLGTEVSIYGSKRYIVLPWVCGTCRLFVALIFTGLFAAEVMLAYFVLLHFKLKEKFISLTNQTQNLAPLDSVPSSKLSFHKPKRHQCQKLDSTVSSFGPRKTIWSKNKENRAKNAITVDLTTIQKGPVPSEVVVQFGMLVECLKDKFSQLSM